MAPTAPTTSVDVPFAVDGEAEAIQREDRYEIFGTMRVGFDACTLARGSYENWHLHIAVRLENRRPGKSRAPGRAGEGEHIIIGHFTSSIEAVEHQVLV